MDLWIFCGVGVIWAGKGVGLVGGGCVGIAIVVVVVVGLPFWCNECSRQAVNWVG